MIIRMPRTGSLTPILGFLFFMDFSQLRALESRNCESASSSPEKIPFLSEPYPHAAAGWGPEIRSGIFLSRWVESWPQKDLCSAPPLKAIPLAGDALLTLNTEARLRMETYRSENQMAKTDDRVLLRGIVGADLRLNRYFRIYSEIGTGQVSQQDNPTANLQNQTTLQQIFADTRWTIGSSLIGTMLGRQEFTDGPRQLISLSDGPNIHKTWNGARIYFQDSHFRLGAIEFRSTQLERGAFDEKINYSEKLRGLNGSFIIDPEARRIVYVDPFWFHSENPKFRVAGRLGLDRRHTMGFRTWSNAGPLRFDWTAAFQTGNFDNRRVNAWALFAVQSLQLSDENWKPRATLRVDLASGGGTFGKGTIRSFNHLYASSNYLGEGQFLSLSNLFLVSPSLTFSPSKDIDLQAEFGSAMRLKNSDAAYAGGMRAYPETQNAGGYEIGQLYRFIATYWIERNFSAFTNLERFQSGKVLRHAGVSSRTYGNVGLSYRY